MPRCSRPGAELVLVGVAVLLDEAVRLQRLQQPVDGRPRHPELVGELRHAEPPRAGGQRLQDPRRAVDGLDRAPRAAGSEIIRVRHCRIGFDSLDWHRGRDRHRVAQPRRSPRAPPRSPRRWPGRRSASRPPAAIRTAGSAPTARSWAPRSPPPTRATASIVLGDLGSAILTARARARGARGRQRLGPARGRPLVEGAIAAAVVASAGAARRGRLGRGGGSCLAKFERLV